MLLTGSLSFSDNTAKTTPHFAIRLLSSREKIRYIFFNALSDFDAKATWIFSNEMSGLVYILNRNQNANILKKTVWVKFVLKLVIGIEFLLIAFIGLLSMG